MCPDHAREPTHARWQIRQPLPRKGTQVLLVAAPVEISWWRGVRKARKGQFLQGFAFSIVIETLSSEVARVSGIGPEPARAFRAAGRVANCWVSADLCSERPWWGALNGVDDPRSRRAVVKCKPAAIHEHEQVTRK